MSSIFLTVSRARFIEAISVPVVAAALCICGGAYAADSPDTVAEAPFLAENDQAMTRMMGDMSIKPTGDVDRDFVGMMIPHHQGALDMAQAELRYGHNEQLRRIAQEIVVEQQQEIIAMRLALGQPLPPPAPAPDQGQPSSKAVPHVSTQPPTQPATHASPSTTTMTMPMSTPMRMNQESK
jgi:hypothetical protein